MSDELKKNQNSGFSIDHSPAAVGEFILYTAENGRSRVECRFENETIWLSQALMAELFDRDVRTINEHLKNLYAEEELSSEATIRNFRIVRREGSIKNMFRFAVTDRTATELIDNRADSLLRNMGLKAWKREIVRKQDATVARNYLNEPEIESLTDLRDTLLPKLISGELRIPDAEKLAEESMV